MNKLIVIVGVIIILGTGYYFYNQGQSNAPVNTQTNTRGAFNFGTAKKSAHYESNTPAHATILPAVPVGVVINFNFDLEGGSNIIINGPDGKDYGDGETQIDLNKLVLRKNVKEQSPDGIYTVIYKACWPDGSCHDGNFQFAINRELALKAVDMRNKTEVIIDMKDIKFAPEMIRVSSGTKITWTNSDEAAHYINTDSHPAHTYYPAQNSQILKKGQSYSLTFNKPGVYPYHCSAHARSMMGILIVE